MRRILFTCFFISFFHLKVMAQAQLMTESWWGLMTSGQIADKWSIWLDTHYVPELFFIGRGGFTYHAADEKFNFTAGYAHLQLTTPFSEGELIRPERRPWGQVIMRLPSNQGYNVSFRFRYDARFRQSFDESQLTDAYNFNHRIRFNNSIRYQFKKLDKLNTALSASFVNETLFTLGPDWVDIPFEHRVFFLMGIQRGASTISPGYHIRFQNTSTSQVRVVHGFVLWINFNYQFKNLRRHFLREFPIDKI